MLISLYSLAYLGSLTGLVLWFFYQHRPGPARMMSMLFLGAFVIYAFSLAFAPGEFPDKLLILFRDMMVLGAASQIFIWAKRSQWMFFALLLLTYGIYFAFYKSFLQESFVVEKTAIQLDENAELLISLDDRSSIPVLEKWLLSASSPIQDKITGKEKILQPAFQIDPTDQFSLDEYVTLDVPNTSLSALDQIIYALTTLDYVLDVEQNEKIFVNPITTSPKPSGKLSFSNDPELRQQWAYDPLKIDKVHSLLKNIKPVKGPAKIAVLDTGVDKNHEDLKAVFYSIDKNGNTDPVGHGTHCAGVIGAVSNNGIGISSMAPHDQFVQITSVKVLSAFGGGTQKSIIQGMIKAADAKVDVISMSLGGLSNDRRQKAYEEAVKYANDKGAIVVVAAGNSNMDGAKYGPANTPGVIAVGAVDENLNKAGFSNTVDKLGMAFSAPGTSIYSTIPKNKYIAYNGTSMACPQVAGLIGIMRAINPSLDTRDIYKILNKHALKGGDYKTVGALIQPFPSIMELVD